MPGSEEFNTVTNYSGMTNSEYFDMEAEYGPYDCGYWPSEYYN